MREQLQYILDLVNHWLKFAEAKNGSLIALIGASLIGIISLSQQHNFGWLISLLINNYLIFSSISLIISISSFIPKTSIPWVTQGDIKDHDNLYFFGDLRKYEPEKLLKKLVGDSDYSQAEKNLAEQIVVNSQITYDKLAYFNCGVWLFLTAFMTPILSVPLFIFLKSNS